VPWSDGSLRHWIAASLAARPPSSVVDVGAGAGAARDYYRFPGARWTAVEIWEPYVPRFRLRERYDEVIVADARVLDPLPPADLYLLCDVLEHMPAADAVRLWDRARAVARVLVISLPVLDYPQGEDEGNPHEAHVHQWDEESVRESFAGITDWHGPLTPGSKVGAFIAAGLAP
jgi:hypothetical protein